MQVCVLGAGTMGRGIAQVTAMADPSRAVGLHFFNPVHLMDLVEVVPGERTGDDTLEFAEAFVDDLGKEAVVVTDSPGFATSRLGAAVGKKAGEGFHAWEDGERAGMAGGRGDGR